MNEEDKRVIRTRAHLAQALIELSCEEGYEAVTIKRITERANINYRTFYRHYSGKDDLLHDVLRSSIADIRRVMPPPSPAELNDPGFEATARSNMVALYEYVAINSKIFQVLLQSGPDALGPLQEIAQKEADTYFMELPLGDFPYELVSRHMVAATFSFIQWWLDTGMVNTPEQMGDFAAQLIMMPIRRLLMEQV
jgi:AcrR family transcriptional regulator